MSYGAVQVTQISAAPLLAAASSSPPRPNDRLSPGVPSWLRLSLSNASTSDDKRISTAPPTANDLPLNNRRLSFARHRSLLSDTSGDGPVGAVARAVKDLLPTTSREPELFLPIVNPAAVDKSELFASRGDGPVVSAAGGSALDPRCGLQAILDGKTRSPVALFDLRRWLARQPAGASRTEAWSQALDFLLAYRAYALKFANLPPQTQALSPPPFALIEQLSRARNANRARARTLPHSPLLRPPPPLPTTTTTANPFATPFDDEHTAGGDFPVPVSPVAPPSLRRTSNAPSVGLEGFEFVTPPQPLAAAARARAASDATTRFLNPRAAGLANTLQPRSMVSFRDLPDTRRTEQDRRATRTSYMTSSSYVTGITDTTVLPDGIAPESQPLRPELQGFLALWIGAGELELLGVDEDLARRTKLEARYTTHPGVLKPVAERVLDSLNQDDGMLDAFLSSGVRNITDRTATARLVWGSAAFMLALLITVLALLNPSPLSHGWTEAVPRALRLIALPFWFVALAYLVSGTTKLCPLLGIIHKRERGASARETMVRQVEKHESRRSAGRRGTSKTEQSRFSVFSSFSADDNDKDRRASWVTTFQRAIGYATDTVPVPADERDPRLRWLVRRNLAFVLVGTAVLQALAVALPRINSN